MLLYVTVGSADEARQIARQLVEERLVACVNIMAPVQSFYWWEGAVQQAEETVFVAKTKQQLVADVIQRVQQLHSYEVPAILSFKITGGNPDYLAWVDGECLANRSTPN